ncbi:VOC family protein [Staphylococcus condimenti]|uniref:VOC family protein n=1 Tax=Staphylococcus condimenti TaxID=70255 RepID=A0A143PAJ0_9STAP|nr:MULTISPECIES: VOC family protein [Staphylococcus]AMY05108.1 glyoxalase [Staphylococcus condimenti]APR61301.1 glyoxalase/bleomycin resistance/extradiol dioxygenase family protein [Staphylococcus condimenti]MDK8645781.1 VOC family protein [Staphylococcus condimenti]OFP02371.1 glyoxalase [Staphylococcus sp. HMSC065E08]PNZ60985.1 VOC family protein [Staphylococcus condimenti]
MINQLDQVMLYVYDQEAAKNFWIEKLDFVEVSDISNQAIRTIVLKPTKASQTEIVLHDKAKVEAMSLGISTDTPSLMFGTDDIDKLYADFQSKGIFIGELVESPQGRVFNFADSEDNYFAVKENK